MVCDLKFEISNLRFENFNALKTEALASIRFSAGHQSLITSHFAVRVNPASKQRDPNDAKIPAQKINRGAQLRGRSTPVFPVRLRRWRARLGLRGVFVAAQKFVSFDLGYHSDAARLVHFGALDAAEAANLHGSGERDFMG